MGFLDKLFRKKSDSDPMALLNTIIKHFNSVLEQTSSANPSPEPWREVVSDLSRFLTTTEMFREDALYTRARAYFYSGMYEEAITDLNEMIDRDSYGDTIVGQPGPKTLRAMANIKLGRFSEAEADLRDQIDLLRRGVADIPGGTRFLIERSNEYYWLLVCKHKGDEKAALDEQSKFFG